MAQQAYKTPNPALPPPAPEQEEKRTAYQPTPLREMADQMFNHIKDPKIRALCRNALRGDIHPDDLPANPSRNSSSAKEVVLVPTLSLSDDVLAILHIPEPGTEPDKDPVYMKRFDKIRALNYAANMNISHDQAHFILRALHENEWTVAEFDLACTLIPCNYECLREAGFEQMIGLRTFSYARTLPQVMAGRLFDRREASGYCDKNGLTMGTTFQKVRVADDVRPFFILK